jgi:hypothetical protein
MSGRHSSRSTSVPSLPVAPLLAAGRRALLFAACSLAVATAGCVEQPVVTLGVPVGRDAEADEDSTVDEAERERVFRELAERECREDEPVCGDDGKTYRNYCQAIANGAQVVTMGRCASAVIF